MIKYTIQRLVAAAVTFFVAMIVIFLLINALPNTLLDTLIDFGGGPGGGGGAHVTEHTVDMLMERFRWDQPLPVQFYHMIRNYLRGDFGISLVLRPNVPVTDIMMMHLPVTMQLNFFTVFLILPFGLLVGISTALLKDKPYDHAMSSLSILFISAPSFVVAALLQYFLAFRMGWFPILLAPEPTLNWVKFHSMILPIVALSFFPIANMGRLLRAELSEMLTSDFMLLARAKGQTYRQSIIGHALRNACVPLVGTFMFIFFGILFGSIVIETIFSIPGISRILVSSINVHDYQLTLAVLFFYVVISLMVSIILDLSLGIIDPRIRMGGNKGE